MQMAHLVAIWLHWTKMLQQQYKASMQTYVRENKDRDDTFKISGTFFFFNQEPHEPNHLFTKSPRLGPKIPECSLVFLCD